MKKAISIFVVLMLLWSTTLGTLTVFGDTEIDETVPVINSLELLNGDNYDASDSGPWNPLKVKLNLTEEGSGVTWISLSFGSIYTDFRYDAEHYVEEDGYCGDVPLFSGEHVIEFKKQDPFPVGEYELVEIDIRDGNGNVNFISASEIESYLGYVPVLKVTKSDYIKETFELQNFRFLETENIDAAGSVEAEITFKSNFEVRWIELSFYDLATGKEERQNLKVSYPEGKGLRSGTHKIKFNIKNRYSKGTKVLYYLDIYNRHGGYVEDFPTVFENDRIQITKGKEPIKDPKILDFNFRNQKITAPDVIKIDLDIEANGNELNQVSLAYEDQNGKEYHLEGSLKKTSNGKYYAEVPVHPFITEGPLNLYVISVENYIESEDRNSCHTSIWESDNPSMMAKGDIDINSGYNITYFGSVGNKKVPSVLKEMGTGETAVLDCRNYKVASKALFEAIAGRDVTVAFVDNNVQWVFNGKNIEKSKCKKINLTSSIQVVSGETAGFPDDKKVAKLIFRDNGELPGEVEMRINYDYLAAKYKFKKENLKLTYLAPTIPELEDSNVDMAKDQYYEYEVDHNSTFVLSKNKAKLGATKITMVPNNLKSVKIKWQKKSCNGYYVYRATKKDGKYKKIATIKKGTTVSYVDKDVKKGKNYYYKVKPYSKKKAYNKTAKMSKPCKAYTKLWVKSFGSAHSIKNKKGVFLSWTYNHSAEKYYIYRATKKSGPYKRIAITTKDKLTDKNVKKNTEYYYKLQAVYKKNSKMNSNLSSYRIAPVLDY